MSTIKDIILFYSSTSAVSLDCAKFAINEKLNVELIPLDSVDMRERAKSGNNFKIEYVPTLLIALNDGNIRLYIGKEKVMKMFLSFISENQPYPISHLPTQSPNQSYQPNQQHSKDNFEIIEKPKKKRRNIKLEFQQEPEPEVESIPKNSISMMSGVLINPLTNPENQNKGNMSNIMSRAKELEQERKSTLKEKGFGSREDFSQ